MRCNQVRRRVGAGKRTRFFVRSRAVALAAFAVSGACMHRSAVAQTWLNPTTGNWNIAGNWVASTPPVSGAATALTFNALAGQSYVATNNIANPFTLNAITFNPAATASINVAGSTISFGGSGPAITHNGAGTATISSPLVFPVRTTVGGAGTGTLTLSAQLTGAQGIVKTTAGPTLVISNTPSNSSFYGLRVDAGNAILSGGGTLTLTSTQRGNDAFSGTNDGGFWSLAVGSAGNNARLTLQNGVRVVANNAFAANEAGGNSTLTISGSGTRLVANNRLGTSHGGGTVEILAGAVVNSFLTQVTRQAGATGTLVVDGPGSTLITSELAVPLAAGANGFVRVSNGGAINVPNGSAFIANAINSVGAPVSSTGAITVTGNGSQFNVSGSGTTGGFLQVGIGAPGVPAAGSLSVLAGASAQSVQAFFGNEAGNATLNVDGANSVYLNSAQFLAESAATASVNVTNGGRWINFGHVFTSTSSNESAAITISGTNSLADLAGNSPFTPTATVLSGGGATGGITTLTVNGGGEVRANFLIAAQDAGGRTAITVDGINSRLTLQGAADENVFAAAIAAGASATINLQNSAQMNVGLTSPTGGAIFVAPVPGAVAVMNVNAASVNAGAQGAQLFVGANSDNTAAGAATFSVTNGGVVDLKQSASIGGQGTLNVGAGTTPATLRSSAMQVNGRVGYNSGTLSTGTLAVGGSVILSSANRNAAGIPSNKKVLEAGTLSLTASGLIDLNDNDAIFKSTSYTTVATEIFQGRNGGAWDGAGITSTAAKNAVPQNRTLGTLRGDEWQQSHGASAFNGRTVSAGDVLVKFTYNGDATLDGRITFDDYAKIDTGFNANRTGWFNGDFNYDGVVNFDDYALIDQAFLTQGTVVLSIGGDLAGPGDVQLIPATLGDDWSSLKWIGDRLVAASMPDAPGGPTLRAVPEPGFAGLIALSFGPLLARRRVRRTRSG